MLSPARARPADDSIFDCTICLSLPASTVVQCRNGHLFCSDCLETHCSSGSSNRSRCPTCRVALGGTPIRCLSAEHAIAAMPSACAYFSAAMTRGEVAAHEESCPQRPVRCRACEAGCTFEGPQAEIDQHEQLCVHVICSGLRSELAEAQEECNAARKEANTLRSQLVAQHCIQAYRDCSRHPVGPGFRVELVRQDADLRRIFPSAQTTMGFNRLLCLMPGPLGTDWEGGCFPVLVAYIDDPLKPPVCYVPPREGPHETPRTDPFPTAEAPTKTCTAAFMHSNTYPSGRICLSTLCPQKGWHPSFTLGEVLISIRLFLGEPNFDDPAQEAPYRLGKADRAAFDRRVREQASRYSAIEFDRLVAMHCVRPVSSYMGSNPEQLLWTEDGHHRIVRGQGG